jgi:hypothetical protein
MFAANTGDPAALVGALTDPRTDPVVAVPAHGRELLLGRA